MIWNERQWQLQCHTPSVHKSFTISSKREKGCSRGLQSDGGNTDSRERRKGIGNERWWELCMHSKIIRILDGDSLSEKRASVCYTYTVEPPLTELS